MTANLNDPIDNLARMVALSATFGEMVAKYTEDGAATLVHQVLAEDPDNLPRPFAVVTFGDMNSERIAGGARNEFASDEDMVLILAAELTNPLDRRGSLKEFVRDVRKVKDEILELAGEDDYLNITGMVQDQAPCLSHEASGDAVPYCIVSWRVSYGRF